MPSNQEQLSLFSEEQFSLAQIDNDDSATEIVNQIMDGDVPSLSQQADNAQDSSEHLPMQDKGFLVEPEDFGVHLLALGRVRGIGIKTLRVLVEKLGQLKDIWELDELSIRDIFAQARVAGGGEIAQFICAQRARLLSDASTKLDRLERQEVMIVSHKHSAFPSQLRNMPDAPYWLFIQGNVQALHEPLIGIVGTRTPSQQGIQTAQRLAAIICQRGLSIVSGLAEGIDDVAHKVGVYYGVPQVAVLGTGISLVFPAATEQTRRLIIQSGGAVITEYLPDDLYSRSRFVERNRIQAALSLALCPVESRAQSGTAHTIRFAEKYKRPVFGAFRGGPDPANDLIRMLADRAYPIFDIEQQADVIKLREWLQHVLPIHDWPQPRRGSPDWFFNDLLHQLDAIRDALPISPEDVKWLQNEIAQKFGYPSNFDEKDSHNV